MMSEVPTVSMVPEVPGASLLQIIGCSSMLCLILYWSQHHCTLVDTYGSTS